MTERAHPEWDDSYAAGPPAPWDIGRPQPAFARLAGEGRLTGRLLDAGCGAGENALLAAADVADPGLGDHHALQAPWHLNDASGARARAIRAACCACAG